MGKPWSDPDSDPLGDILQFKGECEEAYDRSLTSDDVYNADDDFYDKHNFNYDNTPSDY